MSSDVLFDLLASKTQMSKKVDSQPTDCPHSEMIEDCDLFYCSACGIELERGCSQEEEWRQFAESETDKVRCHIRSAPQLSSIEKSIQQDVKHLNIPKIVLDEANSIYQLITGGKILRSNNRKAQIRSSIIHIYKRDQNAISIDSLNKSLPEFNNSNMSTAIRRSQQIMLSLYKKGAIQMSKDEILNMTKNTSPDVFIVEYYDKICNGMNETQRMQNINEIKVLCSKVRKLTSILSSAKPKSLACGLIYFYLTKCKGVSITAKVIAEKVDLTESTINKIKNEIERIRHKIL